MEVLMKILKLIMAAALLLMPTLGMLGQGLADGPAGKIKEESREAAQQIKKDAIETGKEAAQIGQAAKQDSQETWSKIRETGVKAGTAIKEGVKAAGHDIKKAYQETKAAIEKEVSGGSQTQSQTGKTKQGE
jgi:F0F1-type ATP synthase membrane subunit b/b'